MPQARLVDKKTVYKIHAACLTSRCSLEPLGSESLANRIADRLVDAIASGCLEPGQRSDRDRDRRCPGRQPDAAARGAEAAGGPGHPGRDPATRGGDRRRSTSGACSQICEARLALERLALRDAAMRLRAEADASAAARPPDRRDAAVHGAAASGSPPARPTSSSTAGSSRPRATRSSRCSGRRWPATC